MQDATILPALATRKVPGSSSRRSARPSRLRNASSSVRTWAPTSAMSTLGSSGMRPTLKPPPRFTTETSGKRPTVSRVMRATRFHTSGSVAQAMPLGAGHDVVEVLVPDPEARGGPPGVGAFGRTAAQPWVDAHGHLCAGGHAAERLELVQ